MLYLDGGTLGFEVRGVTPYLDACVTMRGMIHAVRRPR